MAYKIGLESLGPGFEVRARCEILYPGVEGGCIAYT